MDEGMQVGWMQNSQLEMVERCLIGLVVESAHVPFPTPANDGHQNSPPAWHTHWKSGGRRLEEKAFSQ